MLDGMDVFLLVKNSLKQNHELGGFTSTNTPNLKSLRHKKFDYVLL